MVSVAIDLMGSDRGLSVTLAGALDALILSTNTKQRHSNYLPKLLLVGDKSSVQPLLNKLLTEHKQYLPYQELLNNQVELIHAEECIGMEDKPSVAIRSKKQSSMRIALDLVKAGTASAIVSAGNTGALVGMSRYVLKAYPGIGRPAIVSKIPSANQVSQLQNYCYMLDLGGNVDCTAEHLLRFAEMGSVLCSELDQLERPRVGLLNIGAEEIKGNEQVKKANELLLKSPFLNYIGNVEADTIYKGSADVIVCDGFAGNIALKASEGVAQYIARILKEESKSSPARKLMGLVALPLFRALKLRIDPNRYNGAILVGLKGNVIKSHGGTNQLGFTQAVLLAVRSGEKNIAALIGQRLNDNFE